MTGLKTTIEQAASVLLDLAKHAADPAAIAVADKRTQDGLTVEFEVGMKRLDVDVEEPDGNGLAVWTAPIGTDEGTLDRVEQELRRYLPSDWRLDVTGDEFTFVVPMTTGVAA